MIKMQDSKSLNQSFDYETNFQSSRKEGLTNKLRQKINTAGKREQESRQEKFFEPDLTSLTARSQVRYHKNNSTK